MTSQADSVLGRALRRQTAATRCDAETGPERGFYYSASKHSAGPPIVAGWSYQWITQLDWAPGPWTAPLDALLIPPSTHATAATIEQVQGLLGLLPDLGLCWRPTCAASISNIPSGSPRAPSAVPPRQSTRNPSLRDRESCLTSTRRFNRKLRRPPRFRGAGSPAGRASTSRR